MTPILTGLWDGFVLGVILLVAPGCETAPVKACDAEICPPAHHRAVNPSLTRAWLDENATVSSVCRDQAGTVFYCKKGVRR